MWDKVAHHVAPRKKTCMLHVVLLKILKVQSCEKTRKHIEKKHKQVWQQSLVFDEKRVAGYDKISSNNDLQQRDKNFCMHILGVSFRNRVIYITHTDPFYLL